METECIVLDVYSKIWFSPSTYAHIVDYSTCRKLSLVHLQIWFVSAWNKPLDAHILDKVLGNKTWEHTLWLKTPKKQRHKIVSSYHKVYYIKTNSDMGVYLDALPAVESTFSQAAEPPRTSSTSFSLGYFLLFTWEMFFTECYFDIIMKTVI